MHKKATTRWKYKSLKDVKLTKRPEADQIV